MADMRTFADLEATRDALGRSRLFTCWARALALGSLTGDDPRMVFRSTVPTHLRAAVPGTTFDPAESVPSFARAFLDGVARATALGRLGSMTLPCPPHVRTPIVTTTGAARFVAAGAPAPLLRLDVDLAVLRPAHVVSLVAVSKELLATDDPRAMGVLERQLRRVVVAAEDAALLDDVGVLGERPAGLLFGLSPVGGGSPDAIADDVRALIDSVRDGEPNTLAFVTSRRGAAYLRALANTADGSLFRDVSIGIDSELAGAPLLLSSAAGARLIALDPSLLGVADDGLDVGVSASASISQDDAPASPANMVSAFQTGSAIIRLIRRIDWVLGAADAAAYITLPLGSP